MSKSHKIILFAVSGFVSLLVFAAVALLLLVDANVYKPRLEAAASEALGMEVSIGGRLGIGFFPGLLVTLEDVRIRNRGADVASAKEASLGIDLLPLFQQEVRIEKVALKHFRIVIERGRDGKFNVERPESAGGALPVLDLAKVSLSNGTILYTDKQSGEGFAAGGCSLDVHRLRLASGKSPDLMKNLSFTAKLSCGELRKNDITVSDLKFSADGKNGVFDFEPVTMRVFGAQGTGSIRADFSRAAPRYHIVYALPKFQIEEFFMRPGVKSPVLHV